MGPTEIKFTPDYSTVVYKPPTSDTSSPDKEKPSERAAQDLKDTDVVDYKINQEKAGASLNAIRTAYNGLVQAARSTFLSEPQKAKEGDPQTDPQKSEAASKVDTQQDQIKADQAKDDQKSSEARISRVATQSPELTQSSKDKLGDLQTKLQSFSVELNTAKETARKLPDGDVFKTTLEAGIDNIEKGSNLLLGSLKEKLKNIDANNPAHEQTLKNIGEFVQKLEKVFQNLSAKQSQAVAPDTAEKTNKSTAAKVVSVYNYSDAGEASRSSDHTNAVTTPHLLQALEKGGASNPKSDPKSNVATNSSQAGSMASNQGGQRDNKDRNKNHREYVDLSGDDGGVSMKNWKTSAGLERDFKLGQRRSMSCV